MAVWQCTFLVVPRQRGASHYASLAAALDDETPWDGVTWPVGLSSVADTVLGRHSSWSEDLWLWGPEEATCLQAYCKSGEPSEVYLRVDLREAYQEKLRALLPAMQSADLQLVDESGGVLTPEWGPVLASLKASSAQSFLDSPEQFLDSLSSKQEE